MMASRGVPWQGLAAALCVLLAAWLQPSSGLAEVPIPSQQPLPPFPYSSPASPEAPGVPQKQSKSARPPRPSPPVAPRPNVAVPPAEELREASAAPVSPVARPAAPPAIAGPPRLLISVRTEKSLYKNGERVKILGKVVNLSGDPVPSVVDLRIFRKDGSPDQPDYRVLVEPRTPDFSDEGFSVVLGDDGSILHGQAVEFIVGAEAKSRGGGEPSLAATSFRGQEIGYLGVLKIFAVPVLIVLGFLVSSLWVFTLEPTRGAAKSAIWVIYASGLLFLLVALVGPVLISVSPTAETLIGTTPVGIAKVTTEKIKEMQWTINIGGTIGADNVLKGGYAVPLFVVVLAIVGCVINMLLKLPEFLREYEAIRAGQPGEAERVSILRDNVFKYFVYILTGPFLGMMLYSLVTLADYTNALALSIMGFSVGFIADRIVETILIVAGNVLTRASGLFKGGAAGAPAAPGTTPSPKEEEAAAGAAASP